MAGKAEIQGQSRQIIIACKEVQGARESKSHADTLYGVIIEADRRASTGAIDDALTLLALAWNDPGTNSLMHQEIERVVSRLDISDSEARSRLSRPPDIDLTSAVEAILDAYA